MNNSWPVAATGEAPKTGALIYHDYQRANENG